MGFFKESVTKEELKDLIYKNDCMINALENMNEAAEMRLNELMSDEEMEKLGKALKDIHGDIFNL